MGKRMMIGTVWKWIFRQIEQRGLTPSQQLALFHVTELINKNFWKPTPINLSRLAASIGQDRRTVKKALDGIVANGLVMQEGEEYRIGFGDNDNDETIGDGGRDSDYGRTASASEGNASSDETTDNVFKYFNSSRF